MIVILITTIIIINNNMLYLQMQKLLRRTLCCNDILSPGSCTRVDCIFMHHEMDPDYLKECPFPHDFVDPSLRALARREGYITMSEFQMFCNNLTEYYGLACCITRSGGDRLTRIARQQGKITSYGYWSGTLDPVTSVRWMPPLWECVDKHKPYCQAYQLFSATNARNLPQPLHKLSRQDPVTGEQRGSASPEPRGRHHLVGAPDTQQLRTDTEFDNRLLDVISSSPLIRTRAQREASRRRKERERRLRETRKFASFFI